MLPSAVAAYAVPLLLSCIAVFVGGLGEDIGREVSPKTRLILSFISALCAIANFSGLDRDSRISLSELDYLDPSWGDRIHGVDLGRGGACDKPD